MAGFADDGALCWRPSRSQVHRRKKYLRIFQAGLKTLEAAQSQQSASYQSLCSWPSLLRPPPGLTRQVQDIAEDQGGSDHDGISGVDLFGDADHHGATEDHGGTDHSEIDHGGIDHSGPADQDCTGDDPIVIEHSDIGDADQIERDLPDGNDHAAIMHDSDHSDTSGVCVHCDWPVIHQKNLLDCCHDIVAHCAKQTDDGYASMASCVSVASRNDVSCDQFVNAIKTWHALGIMLVDFQANTVRFLIPLPDDSASCSGYDGDEQSESPFLFLCGMDASAMLCAHTDGKEMFTFT